MPSAYIEGRGFVGRLFLIVFLAFNAFMAVMLWRFWVYGAVPEVGVAAGMVTTGIILIVWTCGGAVITGLLAPLTRGRRIYVEDAPDEPQVGVKPPTIADLTIPDFLRRT